MVPSWKFFDEIGPRFELQFCLSKNTHQPEVWHSAQLATAPTPWSLFFNPQQNLIFALDSLVDRIVIETQSFEKQAQLHFEDSVTYGLILNWVRRCAKDHLRANQKQIGACARVQFRICTSAAIHQSVGQNSKTEVVLLSLEHSV